MPIIRKNCCVSGASGAEPQINARKCGAGASRILALPGFARLGIEGTDRRGALGKSVFDAAPDALEQCRHVEEIVWGGEANFVGKLGEIGGQRENALARKAGEQENP